MKVRRDELDSFGLLERLPDELKNLEDNRYFVIYYNVVEETSSLYIHSYEVLAQVNFSLYRKLNDKMRDAKQSLKIAFFTNTFETKDGIFYLLLRTYNDHEKVNNFYKKCVEQDRIVDLNVSTDAYSEIYTSDDFRRAISYFCSRRLQEIMQVYDMVDLAMKNRLSIPLYGNSIKKVVNLVVFDGGVLPEIGGTFRFMIIGENANLTDVQLERLNEAKLLLRSMIPIDDIYTQTGWILSNYDGKWRTNIADNEAAILDTNLFDFRERKIYIPSGADLESIKPYYLNPDNLVNPAYKGRLSEVLKHPTLYNYYPQLSLLPCTYWFGNKVYGWDGQRIDEQRNQTFYFSKNERGGFIVMNGSTISGDSLSILLHEVQHSIQFIEGFATGGNEMFAKFVASVGSESVRKIFACINKMQKLFKDLLNNDEARKKLLALLSKDRPNLPASIQIRQELIKLLSSDNYKYESYKINFYFVLYIAEQSDITTSEIVDYLAEKFGDTIYQLFNNITEGYDQSKMFVNILLKQGFREQEISNVLFKGYENLYGEMESRSVQASRFVESQFKNYFYLTKWENAPEQKITVVDGVEEVLDCSKIKAAVETKGDEYILHFKRGTTSEPILHELGHIVFDCLNKLGHQKTLIDEFDKEYKLDINEWFVSKWLAYIKSRISSLNEDLRYHLSSENAVVSELLDDFFSLSTSARLKYLQTILSID
jgi:hypothetical protein